MIEIKDNAKLFEMIGKIVVYFSNEAMAQQYHFGCMYNSERNILFTTVAKPCGEETRIAQGMVMLDAVMEHEDPMSSLAEMFALAHKTLTNGY